VLEVADIFREAGQAYRDRFAARMLPSHLRAMRDIERCRTAALGGHLRQCDGCGALQYSYHSCRNRHCPKCHGDQTDRWLEQQRARLLPCSYFLLTFTLPAELREVARAHQKLVYSILMKSAAQALLKLTADPRYLGARPGMIAVLHSWTRAMLYHPHAHLLVTAGGLTGDGQTWRYPNHPDFLVPGRALSIIFRAKVRDALDKAQLLDRLPEKTWKKKWVVHCQHAGNGEKVLHYIARYLFRIAIANSRLESFDGDQVTFRYRDNHSGILQSCRLPAQEFISRFLQHVLPRGFAKLRSYGLYSPTCKASLDHARSLLVQSLSNPMPIHQDDATRDDSTDTAVSAREDPICPCCRRGVMKIVQTIPPVPGPSASTRGPP
jgi:hypothetical protein